MPVGSHGEGAVAITDSDHPSVSAFREFAPIADYLPAPTAYVALTVCAQIRLLSRPVGCSADCDRLAG